MITCLLITYLLCPWYFPQKTTIRHRVFFEKLKISYRNLISIRRVATVIVLSIHSFSKDLRLEGCPDELIPTILSPRQKDLYFFLPSRHILWSEGSNFPVAPNPILSRIAGHNSRNGRSVSVEKGKKVEGKNSSPYGPLACLTLSFWNRVYLSFINGEEKKLSCPKFDGIFSPFLSAR